jgi:hypothetical protein
MPSNGRPLEEEEEEKVTKSFVPNHSYLSADYDALML